LKTKTNDNELFIVGKMIEGDRDAFKYFFDQYYTDLCNFVLLYVKDKALAEEVVQDIFVYFWESRHKLNISSSVHAYLFSASKYKSLNLIRDRRNQTKTLEALAQTNKESFIQEENLFESPDELGQILKASIELLPERCKVIFTLSKNNNLSNSEIANQLGISVKTVENQMTIALKKLREVLLPYREKLFILFLIDLLSR
jgi:RNA polymerase sigma-70 factor, ECF subfamily